MILEAQGHDGSSCAMVDGTQLPNRHGEGLPKDEASRRRMAASQHRFPYYLSQTEFMSTSDEEWRRNQKQSINRSHQPALIPWALAVSRLEYHSLNSWWHLVGSISISKPDSTMAISAHKNRSWHGEEQIKPYLYI
jgi:hypothetical protein